MSSLRVNVRCERERSNRADRELAPDARIAVRAMSALRAGAAIVSKGEVVAGGFAQVGRLAPANSADRDGAGPVPPPRTAAVLVVEDQSIVAHDLRQTLAGLGYHAIAVGSFTEEGMACATETRPDVALVGIRTQDKAGGIEKAQELHDRYCIPVVYVTTHSDDATLERAKRTRPYGYLLRPVKAAALRSAIEIALVRHQAERAAPVRSTRALGIPAAAPAPARRGRAPGALLVRGHLERILESEDFDASPRSREFLRYVVDAALAGRGEAVTQYAIATRVFQRRADFDPTIDPIVRIQAGRLRRSLERYYLLAGKHDTVRIELPRGTYVPSFSSVAEGDSAPASGPPPQVAAVPPLGGDDWPSLVVRGFEPVDPGSESEPVAARLTEELFLETGRYRGVKIVAQHELDQLDPRGERVRFSLGGILRRRQGEVRVTARLVDRATGEQMWADEYRIVPGPAGASCGPEDIARMIAARVAAEEGVLVQRLAGEYRKRRAAAVTSHGAIVLSYGFLVGHDPTTFRTTLEALRRAVEMEPGCGLAWTRLSRLCAANYAFEVTDLETPLDDAITYAHHGVRLDPTSREARCVLVSALLFKGEREVARSEVEQALRLSPDSLCYREVIGFKLVLLGDVERGVALVHSARERNPYCLPHASFGLWFDHIRRGDYEAAYLAALGCRDPLFFWRSVMRASCLGHLGRRAEAAAEVAELLRRRANFAARGRVLIGNYIKLPEVMSRVVGGLAIAGLKLA